MITNEKLHALRTRADVARRAKTVIHMTPDDVFAIVRDLEDLRDVTTAARVQAQDLAQALQRAEYLEQEVITAEEKAEALRELLARLGADLEALQESRTIAGRLVDWGLGRIGGRR